MKAAEDLEYFLQLLMTEPTSSQLCQQLVLASFVEVDIRAMAIMIQEPKGRLVLAGQFGLSDEASQRLIESSQVPNDAVVATLIKNKLVSNLPSNDLVEFVSMPDFAVDCGPFVITPLHNLEQLFGFVIFYPRVDSAMTEAVNRIQVFRNVIALNSLREFRSLEKIKDPTDLPDQLTPRQRQVLYRISLGETNAKIARNIGFSESTVRHETIRIYRYLRVSDRHAAIEEARRRGELSAEEDNLTGQISLSPQEKENQNLD